MFSDLPLFLGVGFCIGLLWRKLQIEFGDARPVSRRGEARNPATAGSIRTDHEIEPPASPANFDAPAEFAFSWVAIAHLTPARAVALLLAAVFVWRWYAVTGWAMSSATALYLTAGLVGGIAGRWFAETLKSRDKGVAIAAAALFLATAAWDYETHGLRNITKFSAGSVDLELSAHPATGDAAQTASLDTKIGSSPFPGRNRLERAILFLLKLPKDIDRDERFAEMFSGYDRRAPGSIVRPVLEPKTIAFKEFYTNTILPLVCKFNELQTFHKGEVSSISVETNLIYELRVAYETSLLPPQQVAAATPAAAPSRGKDSVFYTAYTKADDEAKLDTLPGYIIPDACKEVKAPSNLAPRLPDGSATAQDERAFIAYFAITSALAEFAIDNRERAIQLLDDVVVHPSPYDPEGAKDSAIPLPADASTAYRNYGAVVRKADGSRHEPHQSCSRPLRRRRCGEILQIAQWVTAEAPAPTTTTSRPGGTARREGRCGTRP